MAWTVMALLFGALVVLFYAGGDGQVAGIASDDFAQLAQLLAMTLLISAGLLVAGRFRVARMIGSALAWGAILAGLLAGYAFRDELAVAANRIYGELSPSTPVVTEGPAGERLVTVRRTARGGFDVTATVNGQAVPMVVDTGASLVTLTPDDARKAGLDPAALAYVHPVQTANGTVGMARVRLDQLAVGPITARRVEAIVAPPGALTRSLLGMSFLGGLASFEVRGQTLTMRGKSG